MDTAKENSKLPLYTKVGLYFTPDGKFKETPFRNFLIENLQEVREEYSDDQTFEEQANLWISSYIDDIIDYLSQKGMSEAATFLLKVVVDVSINFGLQKVEVSSSQLQQLFSKIATIQDFNPVKKTQDEKRKIIFNAALQVFSTEGYNKATIDKIASLSGVGKGSVYRYFKSKEDLLDQLLNESYDEIVERVSQIFSHEADLLDQVEEMIDFWLRYIEKNHVLYRFIQIESIAQKSGDRQMIYDYIVSNLPMFKERIIALNKNNKLKTTSFYSVFYGVLGFIDGIVHKWFRSGRNYSLLDEKPIILEVLFNGFAGENMTRKTFFKRKKK